MGGGNYCLEIANENRATPNAAFQQPSASTRGRLHEALNPYGKAREVNNVTPVVVARLVWMPIFCAVSAMLPMPPLSDVPSWE